MQKPEENLSILMADDDEDDFYMVRETFRESGLPYPLYLVPDGAELVNYLRHEGKYADIGKYPLPDLILLDINMPGKSGFEVLRKIKGDPHLKDIPIVILAISEVDLDLGLGSDWGICDFVTKLCSYDELVKIIKEHSGDWLPSR